MLWGQMVKSTNVLRPPGAEQQISTNLQSGPPPLRGLHADPLNQAFPYVSAVNAHERTVSQDARRPSEESEAGSRRGGRGRRWHYEKRADIRRHR